MDSPAVGYIGVVVSPVSEEDSDPAGTAYRVCSANAAKVWTVYGINPDGTSTALHDEDSASDVALAASAFAAFLGLPVSYADADHSIPDVTIAEMAECLTQVIHDDIPGDDDPDFRDDDFDSHPISALREGFLDAAEASGLAPASRICRG